MEVIFGVIECLLGIYLGGAIGTLILFSLGHIEIYTECRRKRGKLI